MTNVPSGTTLKIESGATLSVAGTHSVATGGTLAVTDADSLTVGSKIVPQQLHLSIIVPLHASLTVRNLYTAPEAIKVTAIKWLNNKVQGGALTATIVKATSTTAPVKTTTPMHTADAIDLNGVAIHTVQSPTLTVTTADLTLAAGDRIGIDHGAMTAAEGVLTISYIRV